MLDKSKNYIPTQYDEKTACCDCSISAFCIPHDLTEDELHSLSSLNIAKRVMEKDEVLYHANETLTKIYAVRTGSFKTLIINSEGNQQITDFYLPGDIIGLDGLAGIAPHSTAIALETSTTCEISQNKFNKLRETNHGLNQSFMRIAGDKISQDQEQIFSLGQLSADARLAGFIISLSNRFQARGYSDTDFNLNMSRHDLANYLGMAAETLSRIIKIFQAKGYIEVQRYKLKIHDIDGLCKLSGTERCHLFKR